MAPLNDFDLMKYFSLLVLAFSVFVASCDSKSGTSTNTAKVLDERAASDIHALLEEMSLEIDRNDARLPEVIHAINEQFLMSSPDDREKLSDLSNAQMVMLQEKMHFDSERTQLPDKIITAASEAVSKEQLLSDVNVLVRDFKSSAQRYQDAYIQLLTIAQSTGSDNPILSEILSELGAGDTPEGGAQAPPHAE